MNPILHWIVTHTAARARMRRCPKCGEEQLVPAARREETVPCRACRAPMPPARGRV